MYNECLQITRQFAFCPNAFRLDMYKGCSFGCQFCRANMDWQKTEDHKTNLWDTADPNKVTKLFYRALETDCESKDILIELIRHRVPVHCGGMADPFQDREWDLHLTRQIIELSNKYHYPIMFSTKTAYLPQEYLSLLNKDIHAFQVSISGFRKEYTDKWECNAKTARERLEFVQMLRNDFNIWCAVRIQPIIDIEECALLCRYIADDKLCDYVTLEHFNCIYDVFSVSNVLKQLPNLDDYVADAGKFTVRRDIKIKNINRLIDILHKGNIKVGVGDNDLHYMSDNRCCCGLDLLGGEFSNYLKYNLTYMCTGEFETDTFIPKCNPRKHINDQKYGLQIDCKQYVDDYVRLHGDFLGDSRERVQKQLFGKSLQKLF